MVPTSILQRHATLWILAITSWAGGQPSGEADIEACRADPPHTELVGSSLLSKSWVVNRTSLPERLKGSSLEISNSGREEAEQLHRELGLPTVVYGVFTSPKAKYAAQLEAVLNTWGRDVPPQKLIVVGVEGTNPNVTYNPAPLCQDGHVGNEGISCKEATLLTEGHKTGASWVIILGSDNYALPRNFEAELKRRDAAAPQILAIWGCGRGQYCEDREGGLCGGAGYAISRAALDKMIGQGANVAQQFIEESMKTAREECGNWSDQVTSCIARRRGVQQVNLDGLHGWSICADARTDVCGHTYRHILEQDEFAPLTFHYLQPEEMYEIHQIKQDIDDSQKSRSFFRIDTVQGDARKADKWLLSYKQHRLEYIRTVNDGMAEVRRSSV
mmetsp:Transcript_120849/g.225984  ORF Transcript_120849/g.225984 Transcript_120849/m.225984 type:complete len:387 (+) Transcript_120849:123-1283(+)